MDEREEKLQTAIADPGIASLWDCLSKYTRGIPSLLLYLNRQGEPVKVGDIANAFNVSMPRVSSMIRRLEFERCVRRVKRKFDYRSTFIELTPKGKEKAEGILATQRELVHRLVEEVGIETLERFLGDSASIYQSVRQFEQEDCSCSA